MKHQSSISRYSILWVVILCYLLPVISVKGLETFTFIDNWNIVAIGLLLTAIGTLLIFWMMFRWESHLSSTIKTSPTESAPQDTSPHPSEEVIAELNKILEEARNAHTQLQTEKEALASQVQQSLLDKEQTLQQIQNTLNEWEEFRQESCKQMEQQQTHIQQLQGTIADQKILLEKRQQQTGHLESKVGDLTYEIKTLLQLAEAHSGSIYGTETKSQAPSPAPFMPAHHAQDEPDSPPPEKQIRTSEEATMQLKRCLDIAQKITGSHRFNNQLTAFLDSPADTFALDLRRLCDSLRSENTSTILLYSPKENQLLFASNQIRTLTGWSPDKFVQNFSDIIVDESAWRQGISSLTMRSEAPIRLSLKTKSGNDIILHGNLGMIPTGIFRQHAIAILYRT